MRRSGKFCLIGALAQEPLYQGNGSSRINSRNVVSLTQALNNETIDFVFAPGYKIKKNCYAPGLIRAAVKKAKQFGSAVVVAGLTQSYESEGADRACMRLPFGQLKLIEALLEAKCKLTVILMCGSPVELPFKDEVEAILNMYCGGEAVGEAIVDLLFGDKNPSGKLAETFALNLEDNVNTPLFPMGHRYVEYRESVFVGYKYFDTANKSVAYPFGHGLSYTDFTYSDLQIELMSGPSYRVSCNVENTGKCDGQEVVQLYVGCVNSSVARPAKELKGFCKLPLAQGQTTKAEFMLDERSFSFYHTEKKRWVVETGEYSIGIGASSRDIRLGKTISVAGETVPSQRDATKAYFNLSRTNELTKQDFAGIYGAALPDNQPQKRGEYDYNSTFSDFKTMWIGKIADGIIKLFCAIAFRYPDGKDKQKQFVSQLEVPVIREGFDKGTATKATSDAKLYIFNKSLFGGLIRLIFSGKNKK